VADYIFRQYCRPRGDLREKELSEFLALMKDAFRFPIVYDGKSMPVDCSSNGLVQILRKDMSLKFAHLGVHTEWFSLPPRNRDEATVRFEISTGTSPDQVFLDSYDISIGDGEKVPNFHYIRQSIQIFRPFEAYLSETENEYTLDAYNRQQAIPRSDKPAIIRGFHYLDEGMADSIGGIDYCLKAPAWRVERFCQGVLIELVPGLFDTFNLDHVQVQHDVMDYFDML
jgi:hypothetical protein